MSAAADTTPEHTQQPTVMGVYNALTYPEEVAIRRRFEADVEALFKVSNRAAGRALLFAHRLMSGVSEHQAFDEVSRMTFAEVEGAFAPEPEEVDDEAPETDEGKPA